VKLLLTKYPNLVNQYEASKGPMPVSDDIEQGANGVTPAVTPTGDQGPSGITEAQINALIEAALSADREAEATTEPSPETVAAKQAITDLIEGYETEGEALEETFDIKELTKLYEGEVTASNTAITTATTAIADAIAAQLEHIEEQEERIPELSRMASRAEPTRGVGRGQQSYIKRMRQKEIALNMRNKISGKKQALSAIEADLASLEKQAQEARRNQNVQALMDIKRQQINLIGELRLQTLGKKQDALMGALLAELNHQNRMDQIRLELKKGPNQAMGIQFYNRLNEIHQLLTIETDPDEITRLRQEKDLIEGISQGSSSTRNSIIGIMSKAEDEEQGIAKVIAAHGMEDAVRYVHGIKMKKSFSKGAINTLLGLKTTEELVDATGEISFEEFVEAVKALSKNKDKFKGTPPSTMEEIALLWLNVS